MSVAQYHNMDSTVEQAEAAARAETVLPGLILVNGMHTCCFAIGSML